VVVSGAGTFPPSFHGTFNELLSLRTFNLITDGMEGLSRVAATVEKMRMKKRNRLPMMTSIEDEN
jgi:hypothetical protein